MVQLFGHGFGLFSSRLIQGFGSLQTGQVSNFAIVVNQNVATAKRSMTGNGLSMMMLRLSHTKRRRRRSISSRRGRSTSKRRRLRHGESIDEGSTRTKKVCSLLVEFGISDFGLTETVRVSLGDGLLVAENRLLVGRLHSISLFR